MNKEDEKLLEKYGWTVECYSPFEISTKDGSFARCEAANYVLESLKSEDGLLDEDGRCKWEYRKELITIEEMRSESIIEEMNKFGIEGWEIFSISQKEEKFHIYGDVHITNYFTLFMKRSSISKVDTYF